MSNYQITEQTLHPKVRRRDDGSTERTPLNILEQYDIQKRREKQIVRNLRHKHDPNELPEYMKTFSYYVRGEKVTEDAVYEFPNMTIVGESFSSELLVTVHQGRSTNFSKLHNAEIGLDGTFSMSKLERTVDNKKVRFKQVLMLVMKHEKTTADANGNNTTKVCTEPVFCALVTDKKIPTYIDFWNNMIQLHDHYYPDEGQLQLG